MSYESLLTEDLTIWIQSGIDKYAKIEYFNPIYIKCRYQDLIQRFIDANGTDFTSSAVIYTTTEIPKNSFIYRGISLELDPILQIDSFKVRVHQRSQTPDQSIVVYKTII